VSEDLEATKQAAIIPLNVSETSGTIIRLENWKLVVESWSAGASPTETNIEIIEKDLTDLKPWVEIEGLRHVSGIGRYFATFWLEEKRSFSHAMLDLGKVSDTFRVKINGRQLPVIDQISRRVAIGNYLKYGLNSIEVEVATTLNNALCKYDSSRTLQEYGLMGPVIITLHDE